MKPNLKFYKRIKALACNFNCANAFREDRRAGLNYGLFRYADGTFAKDREEVSCKLKICAYCGAN